ncbi:MAG: hypothetical protein LC114_20265 [Bryobacterales bacterium]|nr:hypothetical protein [Bryobacterales bacterium]
MPEAPLSSIEQELSGRPFAFFPPIRNVEYNEWRFLQATWSEILVSNPKAGLEVWIPRRHFGTVSSVDQPIPIVGLTKELELRAGNVLPVRTKVLEMPGDVLGRRSDETAPQTSISSTKLTGSSPRNEGSVVRLIGIVLAVALLAVFAVVAIHRSGGVFRGPGLQATHDQDYLSLSGQDDYAAVVRRLGKPGADRWNTRSKEVVFRVLDYPNRGYSVILFGADQATARYIGTMDRNWRPIHSVSGRGTDYSAMLRTLPKF